MTPIESGGAGAIITGNPHQFGFSLSNQVNRSSGELFCARATLRTGAVVSGGMLFVDSGYGQLGGMPGNVLLAFGASELGPVGHRVWGYCCWRLRDARPKASADSLDMRRSPHRRDRR